MKVGIGIDFHRLAEGRKLIIGGVEIECEKGLIGYSDADVLTHSICDALLGAAGLGDIGQQFPDTDEQYRGISSLKLLGEVKAMLQERGYQVNNIDSVTVAEAPKLAAYIPEMIEKIAITLEVSPRKINIKATTAEKMGALGRGEGIAAYSIASLRATTDQPDDVVIGNQDHQPDQDHEADVVD